MIGVIAGDVIGSVHEHALTKRTDFALFDPRCRFTDDTVLTVATAYAILNGTPYATAYRDFGREHPNACGHSQPLGRNQRRAGNRSRCLHGSRRRVERPDPGRNHATFRAIRLAVSLGGDADTQAAIAGGIAEAFYRWIPDTIVASVRERLPPRFNEVIDTFREAFPLGTKR
jgi:ADP-ribosylglycohydrolase